VTHAVQIHLLRPVVILWLLLPACGLLVVPARAQEPPPDSFRYRVDVQLVLLSASVLTPEGRPVTDLEQEAFEVYEDGQLRPIKLFERKTALPLQLVLLVDASLSAASELKAQKAAMARFIQRVLLPKDTASLYELSGKSKAVVDFCDSPRKLQEGLQQIEVRAGTALYDATVEAYCLTEATSKTVTFTWDGTPYTTPQTFTGITGSHTALAPDDDSNPG